MTSLRGLNLLQIVWKNKAKMITLFEVSKFPLFHAAGNKMSLSLAPTEHLSLLFCIEEYLVELLGWVA